mgnify:FL=1
MHIKFNHPNFPNTWFKHIGIVTKINAIEYVVSETFQPILFTRFKEKIDYIKLVPKRKLCLKKCDLNVVEKTYHYETNELPSWLENDFA